MKKKKVAVGIGIFAAAIGILCMIYTGCRKEPEPGQEEVFKETVEVKTREELPKETKEEASKEQKEEPENLALEEKELEESAPVEPAKKEQASTGETKEADKKEESAPAPVKEPEPVEEKTQKSESVPETPPAAETPAPESGFDAEQEAILFARINESRGGDLVEGTWAKDKAREKAKAQDGSGSGVLFGYNTTGDAGNMAEKLIASYGSTIGMGWKSFGCGVYQSGGTYYYCVVFDTMTD